MRQTLLLASRFLDDPGAICSIIPTLRRGVQRVCRGIRSDLRRVIVEYGAGTGVIAEELLQPGRLTKDSKLILIERDRMLAASLRRFDDPRVRIVQGDAMEVADILKAHGSDRADHVLSSIPHSRNPPWSHGLFERTKDILQPEGSFIVFLFRYNVRLQLQKVFPRVESELEWLNVPPLRIFTALPEWHPHLRNGTPVNDAASASFTPPRTSASPAP